MRKTVLLIASVTAVVLLASVAALADVINGTDGDDTNLQGTGRTKYTATRATTRSTATAGMTICGVGSAWTC